MQHAARQEGTACRPRIMIVPWTSASSDLVSGYAERHPWSPSVPSGVRRVRRLGYEVDSSTRTQADANGRVRRPPQTPSVRDPTCRTARSSESDRPSWQLGLADCPVLGVHSPAARLFDQQSIGAYSRPRVGQERQRAAFVYVIRLRQTRIRQTRTGHSIDAPGEAFTHRHRLSQSHALPTHTQAPHRNQTC